YGIINHIIQLLVEEKFGQEYWNDVKNRAGDIPETFIMKQNYDDKITYDLVRAIMDKTGMSIHQVFHAFGNFWVEWTERSNYIIMMRIIGPNLYAFLNNLNALHVHLSMTFSNMIPPEFYCERTDNPNIYRLHYHSNRKLLRGVASGIIERAAEVIFNLKLEIECIYDGIDEDRDTYRNYAILEIREIGLVEANKCIPSSISKENLSLSPQFLDRNDDSSEEFITGEIFCDTFPFHIIFDDEMTILRTGTSLSRKLRRLSSVIKPKVTDLFQCSTPPIRLNKSNIMTYINNNFTLQLRSDITDYYLNLKGQMIRLKHERFLFICSPVVDRLADLEKRGLYISDFPIHDHSRELMLLNEQRVAEFHVHKRLEETTAMLEKTSTALAKEKIKTDNLLHSMLPPTVAEKLREGHEVEAGEYEFVTVLFSDIVGFTSICSRCKPIDVVEFLNNLYTRFDQLTSHYKVYKVETIGDAYMVVSGVPDVTDAHAQNAIDMGLAMIEKSVYVCSPADGKQIQIRIGIHSGPVVAGVVGHKMPRYCLFGDTVNTASRMESHGVPGTVHISSATYELVKESDYKIQLRGDITIKGKGIMRTYFVLSGNQVEIKEVETVVNDTSNNHRGQIRSQQWLIVEEDTNDDDTQPSRKLNLERIASTQCDAGVQVNLEDENGLTMNSKALEANPPNNHGSRNNRRRTITGKNKARSSMCSLL
ncbi:uncharacterized protein TRIADDRAFT_24043, partial [Trichoplax adhaerens]